jgi:hypothetical protein
MASVVVAGALANKPANGGAAWTRLSWALGFARLGYRVHFVEQIAPASCIDERGARCALDDSINLAFFRDVTQRFGLDATLIVEGEGRTVGLRLDELADAARSADMLVNISGHLTIAAVKDRFRKRLFIDLDPGYTQFWHADGLAEDRLCDHDLYFSVGENIGESSCGIPTGQITWRPIRQPIVLDEWPVVPCAALPIRFTTVASWRGPLGRATRNDTLFGVKAHEFRKFISVPAQSESAFEIALEIDPADRHDMELLRANRWTVVDPKRVVPDPVRFRRYVQHSSAEFSVAQGVYVETQSGWFSDRTVRYLASGKPALVQDTGWSRTYPSGCGLLAFRTLEQALDGAERIARNYGEHARAARAIAEEFFDSSKVLAALVDAADGRRG